MSTTNRTVGDVRLAPVIKSLYVEVRTCPFCELGFERGTRFSEHWEDCDANNLEPLSAVRSSGGERPRGAGGGKR